MNDERKRVENLLESDKGKWIKLATPAQSKPFEFRALDDVIQIRTTDRNEDDPDEKGTPFPYKRRCIADLRQHLENNQDWHLLGAKDGEEMPKTGCIEEWARSDSNPVGGYYGENNYTQGRFASFIPPILEYYHLAEVEHNPSNNRMRYKISFL